MKDRLEQFISENRDSFDSFDGKEAQKIWEKIHKDQRPESGRKVFMKYFSRAAAVLLIFVMSYLVHDIIYRNREARLADRKLKDIYEQLPELKEAENYYGRLVSGKLKEIQPFLSANPEIGADVHRDLIELDSVYNTLKSDLKDNIANDQIIEAMIQNYRLKLRILEDLQAEIKLEKNKENEKQQVNI
jgi:hypothetical protein